MVKITPNLLNEIGVIFIALIVAYFIYRAYAYLGNLESCQCAPQSIVQNLKMIELYYLLIILAGIIFNIIYLIFNIDYTELVTKYKYLVGFIIVYIISVFGFYFYYIYNVIEFKAKLNSNCSCANEWQNNIIYLHALYLSLPIILTILSALFKFEINVSVITLIIILLVSIYLYEKYLINNGKINESMTSMLGNYQDMVYEPAIYNNNGKPYESKDGEVINTNYNNFSPSSAQPLQEYRQIKPDEYPQYKENEYNLLQTPLSTHEKIVLNYRK